MNHEVCPLNGKQIGYTAENNPMRVIGIRDAADEHQLVIWCNFLRYVQYWQNHEFNVDPVHNVQVSDVQAGQLRTLSTFFPDLFRDNAMIALPILAINGGGDLVCDLAYHEALSRARPDVRRPCTGRD